MSLIKRQAVLSILLATAAVVAAAALLAGGDPLSAFAGALLVVGLWLLELAAVRAGSRGSFAHGLLVGLLGMVIRLAVALGILVAVGVLASRATFVAFVLGFVASYTIYLFVRLWRPPAVSPSH